MSPRSLTFVEKEISVGPLILLCWLLAPAVAGAQEPSEEWLARLQALEERVHQLEAELAAIRGAPAAPPPTGAVAPGAVPTAPAPPGTTAEGTQLPVYGGAGAAASKIFNPDISVIGNFTGAVGRNPIAPRPALEMRETEIGFQAVVDPFARADFFLDVGEEGIDLEEGYITFTALPAKLLARVGKFRSSFGVVNAKHNDALPWIDRPLVTENLMGGEEGLSPAGLGISRILPAPMDVFLELTAEVSRGDAGDVFQSSRRRDFAVVSRLRGYKDLTEETNLDLGVSYARGHNDLGSSFTTDLYGFDATLRWKPLRRAIYHSFLWRTEFVWSNRQELIGANRAFGLYSGADYRLNRRWTLGGRYDRSGRGRDAELTDTGFSAILTYWPSEFSQVRWQYRFTRYAEGRDANELLFQVLFNLGAHGAHPF
jgi:hypothetical protein